MHLNANLETIDRHVEQGVLILRMTPMGPGLSSYAESFSVGAVRYTRNTTTVPKKS